MLFQIVEDSTRTIQKFKTVRRSVCFRLNTIPDDVDDPERWVKNGIKEIVTHIAQNIDPEDRVGFTFNSEGFDQGAAYLPFRKAEMITFQDVWGLLAKIYQSKGPAFHSDTFRMTMTQVKPYRGAGRVSNYTACEDECAQRRGIVSISNNDNLCLVRALVVAIAYATQSSFTKELRENRGKMQDIETEKLLRETGVTIPETGATIDQVRDFQAHLSDYKITVYAYGSKGRTVLFEGQDAPLKLNLLHHNNHFNVITNLKAAFVCRFYCGACHVPYNNKNNHRCAASCPCCQQSPPCEKTREEVTCADCHRKFRGTTCFDKHKEISGKNGKSLCDSVKKCEKCLKTVMACRQHTCDEVYCRICNQFMAAGHFCYMKTKERKPPTDGTLFVFYDLETRQDQISAKGEKIHVPNLCVFQQRCDLCMEQDDDVLICYKCCVRRQVLKIKPLERFVEYVLGVAPAFKNIVVMAHNGKAYDHQFTLKHVLENTDRNVELIMRGTSIIMMKIGNVKFIDSINYFPMPLSVLPKAFDLGPELKKGYFPYFFNTLANASYDGSLPALEYYDPDHMTEDARRKLMEWHEEHQHDNFNMERDLTAYCVSDVDILTKACLKFRKMFLEECNVCPFIEATTIASACNLVFRRNFLQPDTIGIIPKNGYRTADNQSKIATLWLIHEETHRGVYIINSAKQREALVEGVKVDGYCEETKQVFEFHGCYYHGHTCMSSRRDEPLRDDPSDTMNNRYERTLRKTERLRQRGYEVVEMWECEFRKMLGDNKALKMELETSPLLAATPLDPRHSFYGGRTGNCKTYYQVKAGEKIKYVDVCSLYPYVCKYSSYPIGHPKVHVGAACQAVDLQTAKGLIKCQILPPQNLYHPLLPLKMNGKLMFVLCRTCGVDLNHGTCTHSDEQRALIGTWVMDEVQKALQKGYRMLDVYEVWEYKVEQYDTVKKTGGLFTKMMDKFIRMKQQASGWPADCETKEEKNAYIEEFFEKEGIRMEFREILKNPGLRALAKLMLNSFWGKFGQRENQSKTEIVRQPHQLEELLSNPAIDVNIIHGVNEETMTVTYEYKDEAADILATVNVCIAAHVTTHARLKLYSYLDQLGDRVLYYDTDSIMYISRPGEWDVPTGSCLGEMTDELEDYGPGSYITTFASGGPKNYSYVVFSPKYHTYYTSCKVKGIRLNYNALKLVNFFSMAHMIVDKDPEPVYITSNNIRRTKDHEVITREETKIYRVMSEKRKFDESFSSTPYGYNKRQRTTPWAPPMPPCNLFAAGRQ